MKTYPIALLISTRLLSGCGEVSDSDEDDITATREFLSHAGEAMT